MLAKLFRILFLREHVVGIEPAAGVVERLQPELAALWVALEEGAEMAAADYRAKGWAREDHPQHFSATLRASALELELLERADLGHFELADQPFDSIELIHRDGTRILALARPREGGLPVAKTKKRMDWYAANAQLSLFEHDAPSRHRHIVLLYAIDGDGTFTAELAAPAGGLLTYWLEPLRLEDLLDALPGLKAVEAPLSDEAGDLILEEEDAS